MLYRDLYIYDVVVFWLSTVLTGLLYPVSSLMYFSTDLAAGFSTSSLRFGCQKRSVTKCYIWKAENLPSALSGNSLQHFSCQQPGEPPTIYNVDLYHCLNVATATRSWIGCVVAKIGLFTNAVLVGVPFPEKRHFVQICCLFFSMPHFFMGTSLCI